MELVSIIVPVYNVEKYLRQCIKSLINQTYSKIEIILVDDGSTDSSGSICDEYSKNNLNISVIHKKNEGLGFARNSGLEKAQGEYVTFIDSDDVADLDLVELLMEGIKKSKADTCIGGFKRVSEDGKLNYIEQYEEEIFENQEVYDVLFAKMLGSAPDKHDAIRMSVWNVMYSMKIIKKYNIKFSSEREFISEDIIWDSEYFKYSKRVKVINSTAYSYRITPGSLTQKYKPNMLDKICTLYLEMKRRVDEEKNIRLQRQFLVNLRMCIKQEKKSISKKQKKEIKKAIRSIVEYKVVKDVVDEYYKLIKQKKQKIFIALIKYRCINLIYWIIEKDII